ncbi:hypothetical protein [uncultured Paraglaciecola sp.]|uniref:hypothetical protein n=1 Tax=uncultured Paraglaciecola sp. TaxID=1765024 RepID=UPI0026158A2C|nr:hypothetical protein [uncultured Paraglaciecola sp.]
MLCWAFIAATLFTIPSAYSGTREQAKRIHDRLAGVPPSSIVLEQMENLMTDGKAREAADLAMSNPAFYSVTLKNWITPWTNEDSDVFAPLNDYTATVIGIVRDDIDFRQILSGDLLYIANASAAVPAYSINSNAHYQALEDQSANLKEVLQATTQSALTAIPADATAGVMTTRAAAKSYFKDGTNRAMFRFTLINHLCTDLEGLKDTSRSPDRVRQDVSRSPGGDSRIFNNSCVGCHSGMDPLAQAFAYYNYEYNLNGDPDGEQGSLQYNQAGDIDAATGSRVQKKYQINSNNFPYGFSTNNDNWSNYWRQGLNKNLGWDESLPATGSGAKSMGQELANSQQFATCQVTKVFENICLRSPQNAADRTQITHMTNTFTSTGYNIKQVFADSADYCKGE